MSALLEVEALACGYFGSPVVTEVSFAVEAGEVVALLGPNGSGKSTLLKTLAKTLQPLSGDARVEGDSIRALGFGQLARRLGYVPQSESPVFAFSAWEVVLMGRLPHSDTLYETPDDVEAARTAMLAADCLQFAERPITELSGGEVQRVLIARALAQEAKLLLLDEPTSHLDVAHQLAIGDLLVQLSTEGYGILVAVHDLNWAATFAGRGLLLSNGRLAFDAPMTSMLRDERLESAYEVRFDHVADPEGHLRVFPKGG